jgi:PAS domain S-box-containing protein
MRNIIESLSNILPFMRSEQAQMSDEIQPQDANGKTPITILVVDDDSTIRKTLTLQLEVNGNKVITAKNGEEGIYQLSQHDIDLMLLDLQMPGMTGIDVLNAIREKHNALQLPIIMLTSCDESQDMVRALEAGANDYVIKSGDISVLMARIETQFSLKTMNIILAAKKEDLQRGIMNNKIAVEMAKADLGHEIKNRLEAESALIHSETRFRVLYDNSPAMCFIVDTNGEIQSANRYAAHVLGYDRSALINHTLFTTYHGEDGEKIRQCLAEAIELSDRPHRWEIRRLHKDGHVIWVRETAKKINNMVDQPTILIVSVEISKPST